MRRASSLLGFVLSFACWASSTRGAAPGDGVEEQVADGNLDAEDLVARGPRGARGRAPTYLGVSAFTRASGGFATEIGVMLVAGIPLDRVAVRSEPVEPGGERARTTREADAVTSRGGPARKEDDVGAALAASDDRPSASPGAAPPDAGARSPVHLGPRARDPEGLHLASPAAEPEGLDLASHVGAHAPEHVAVHAPEHLVASTAPAPRVLLAAAPRAAAFTLTPPIARASVAAAWRAAGLTDAAIDATLGRARLAAALPEARLRAVRSTDQSARVDALPDEQRTVDARGANLYLEARLTWRLDRLVYGDDEPQLERIRGDRQDARARVAARTLELLVRWQRALEDARLAVPGTQEEREAELHALEATVALDVLTDGWFTTRVGN